jgi:hypothetical protein
LILFTYCIPLVDLHMLYHSWSLEWNLHNHGVWSF